MVVTPQRVIRSYFLIAGLYTLSAALIWGVNTLFLLDAGLDIFGVFIANSAFTAGMVAFEIPTGVLADTRGRKASFLMSVAILFATTLGYVMLAQIGGGLLAFSAMSVVMGLGFTFYSGAVEAWLVDALDSTGYEGQLDRVFARGAMVTGAAMLVGTVGGGLLGTVDLALPYVVRAGMLATVFGVALAKMSELGFKPRAVRLADLPAEMNSIAQASIKYGWQKKPIRFLMGVSFLQFGFMAWGWYAWQPYFLELLGRNAVWVAGAVAALVALSMIAGNALADWFSQYCGRRTTLLLYGAAVQTAAVVGVGLANSFWLAVALFLLGTTAMGVMAPAKQAYLHQIIPSEHRASVVSFNSMLGNTGSVFGQVGLGYLSRARSIAEGYVVGGLITMLVLPLVGVIRGLGERADVIIGRAGKSGPCAAQGVPQVGLVDTTARQAAG